MFKISAAGIFPDIKKYYLIDKFDLFRLPPRQTLQQPVARRAPSGRPHMLTHIRKFLSVDNVPETKGINHYVRCVSVPKSADSHPAMLTSFLRSNVGTVKRRSTQNDHAMGTRGKLYNKH